MYAPKAAITMRIIRLINCWPGNLRVVFLNPCSFAKATKLPLNDTAPINPPRIASIAKVRP